MTVGEVLAAATRRLAEVSETPRLDAELLMAHALGTNRERLLLDDLHDDTPAAFGSLVERRLAHEPVAYIIGRRDFWTLSIEVGPGALIPRPDSETLIEAAVERFGAQGPQTILDLGTGPGTLLLAALDQWPAAEGIGIDRSPAALAYARRNAHRLGLAQRARFVEGDWASAQLGRFDLVLCNPPYVASSDSLPAEVAQWEPAAALYAAGDGLAAFCVLAPLLRQWLAAGGIAVVEIGVGQREAAAAIFSQRGFTVSSRLDLKGIPRCLVLDLGERSGG
ncbi:MAG: peptide chain release factor N(5)-glutamine methyltransferase [Sphingosinicella sp.]